MLKKQHLLKKRSTFYHLDSKQSLIIGTIIATLIAISPYLFYLYESVPEDKVWNTFLFTYDSKNWESANFAIWVLTGKLVPLLFLFIWFFTCRHWWYHSLLVPIAMYVYQIFDFFNSTIKYIDELQLIYLIPMMAIVVPSIYLIRARLFNKINNADKSMQELEDEFKATPKNFVEKVKQYF